ncbi:MAG TPA: Bax inhibitor-1/YccA family protein [Dermatophilaceae bacterium]|nr:Bax inhibitor-1/YccA family protein [Dermatophilaceae bacterium]
MSSNPVFSRIDREAERGYAGFRDRNLTAATTGYAAQDQLSAQQLEEMYRQAPAGPVQTGRITMDDVVMKTLGLFSIVLVLSAVGWMLAPTTGPALLLGGIAVTLVLGLVIAFKKTISVPLIVTYAAAEGLLVGSVSNIYSRIFDQPNTPVFEGIVAQAVLATLSVFAGMFLAYRFGFIRVTDKFRRFMGMALIGYLIFAVVNFAYAWFGGGSPFGFGGTGMLGIGISLFACGLAAFSLALDFDSIDRAIAAGAPQKYSWLLAHGLIVTLVWLYLEILRLLARLRSD